MQMRRNRVLTGLRPGCVENTEYAAKWPKTYLYIVENYIWTYKNTNHLKKTTISGWPGGGCNRYHYIHKK